MQVLCCPWVMSSCGHADQRLSQTDYPANSMPAADVISGPTPKSRAATVLRQRKGSSLPLGLGSLQARAPRFPHLAVFCTKYRFYDTTRLEMAATGECYRPPQGENSVGDSTFPETIGILLRRATTRQTTCVC